MKIDLAIGGGSAVIATAIPDTLLAFSGKLAFAVITAVIASFMSRVVGTLWERYTARRAPTKEGK